MTAPLAKNRAKDPKADMAGAGGYHSNETYQKRGWPEHIADNEKRETEWFNRMRGRRYDDPGLEVRFK